MQGFTPNALLLLPQSDKFNQASSFYKKDFKLAMENLVSYLAKRNITPQCFITDELAFALFKDDTRFQWLSPEDRAGTFYLQNRDIGKGVNAIPVNSDIKAIIDKRVPVERGTSFVERGVKVQKRVSIAEREIIKQAHCVFVIGNQYKGYHKDNDGRAVFYINSQFIPTLKLSGNDSPIASFLAIDWGNLALTEWGKYDGSVCG